MKTNMNSQFNLIAVLLVFTFFNCKQQNTFSDYKFADKPQAISCEGLNSKLYNEALYSFEDDILNYYQQQKSTSTLVQAYSQFLRGSNYGRLKLEDFVSKHTLDVFEALKEEADLWDANNTESHLNYHGKTIRCISENIKDANLKATLNALISTNSMSPKLFGAPLLTKYRNALNDKYLALYITLDLYYSNLFELNLDLVNLDKPEQQVDFNKLPPASNPDPHAGHNH
ncbi:hypothetical protein [Algibacter mikhailovii]|nr:hypothetical protein [Algibacter mikhailovii]